MSRSEPTTPVPGWRAAAVTIAFLVGVVAVRSTVVPKGAHFALHCGVIVALVMLARAFGFTADELGVERSTWRTGALAALMVFLVVGAVVATVVWIGHDATTIDDDRVAVSTASMLWKALVVIPIGTVVMEELAFRGILLAAFRREVGVRAAVLWSSMAFGVWHVVTAWNTATGTDGARLASVLGTVVATTLGGAVFCWLRLRYRSLFPAMAAHAALNSVTFAVAWLAAR